MSLRTCNRLVTAGVALIFVSVVLLWPLAVSEYLYAADLAGVLPAGLVAALTPVYLLGSLFFPLHRSRPRREVAPRAVSPVAAWWRRVRRLLVLPQPRVAGAPSSVRVRRRPRPLPRLGAS